MIDSSEKCNRQLAFELHNSHVKSAVIMTSPKYLKFMSNYNTSYMPTLPDYLRSLLDTAPTSRSPAYRSPNFPELFGLF